MDWILIATLWVLVVVVELVRMKKPPTTVRDGGLIGICLGHHLEDGLADGRLSPGKTSSSLVLTS